MTPDATPDFSRKMFFVRKNVFGGHTELRSRSKDPTQCNIEGSIADPPAEAPGGIYTYLGKFFPTAFADPPAEAPGGIARNASVTSQFSPRQ